VLEKSKVKSRGETNFSQSDNWLKKLIYIISATGISTIIGLPVLSQSYYPPMVFFQPLAYPNYPQRSEKGNLVNGLKSNTNLKNLVAEVKTAGLIKQLQQEQFTVLAPNDQAFNALPDEVFDKFSQPENRLKVLQYHLIPGKVTKDQLKQGKITTLTGDAIAVSSDNNTNTLKLNNAQATFPPIVAKNGVIIEIDQVLFPPGF
jgi:uncharacterized surface protein with fasciclin (FAS1) repeats